MRNAERGTIKLSVSISRPQLNRLINPHSAFRIPRRRSQVVRRRSAKPLYAGSIPAAASKLTRGEKIRDTRVHIMVYGAVGRRQNDAHKRARPTTARSRRQD